MKIIMVNSFFPPWRGGAETYTYNLARAMVEKGSRVTVLCANEPLPPGVYRHVGVIVKRHRLIARVYGTPIMPSLLNDLLNLEADVFHGNFPSPYIAFLVAAASRLRGIPAVLTWHNDLPAVTSGARFLLEAHDRLILPKYVHVYRRVISTSEDYRKRSRILGSLEGLVTVVPNGVDCNRFHPKVDGTKVRSRLGLGGTFTVIFVGALTRWHGYKGLDTLLHAMRMVVAAGGDVRLMVVGDGDLKEAYGSLAHQLGVAESTVFVGDISDSELPQYYSAADALMLPSKDMSEGFGLTVLEANATGKPAIASRVGGIPSIIRDGYNGIMVPPKNPRALAEAILKLKADPRKAAAMGLNGRRVAEKHDWQHVASETLEVYLDALHS